MTHSIAQTHTTTHSSITSVTQLSTQQQGSEYTSCSYQSEQSQKDHLMSMLQQQPSVFAAASLVREINRLNGYKVVTDYELAKIKSTYSNQINTYEGLKDSRYGDSEIRKMEVAVKTESKNDKYRELQKAYMKLLSI